MFAVTVDRQSEVWEDDKPDRENRGEEIEQEKVPVLKLLIL
jgi:hypothetical protein